MDKKQLYLSTVDSRAGDLARAHGLGVEIADYCTAWNMDDQYTETDGAVRKSIHGVSELVLHAPFTELFPCAIDPKARQLAADRYLQAIALAQLYGARKVVIHGGYNPWIYYPVWYLEQSVVFWKDFSEKVPEGITVCLENVLEETPEMLRDIVQQTDRENIKMCLDIGHAHAYSKIPVEQWLEVCAPVISHFHIHNNFADTDSHLGLSVGTIPMEALLCRADSLCPNATYTLELTDSEESVVWLKKHFIGR